MSNRVRQVSRVTGSRYGKKLQRQLLAAIEPKYFVTSDSRALFTNVYGIVSSEITILSNGLSFYSKICFLMDSIVERIYDVQVDLERGRKTNPGVLLVTYILRNIERPIVNKILSVIFPSYFFHERFICAAFSK